MSKKGLLDRKTFSGQLSLGADVLQVRFAPASTLPARSS
jgi:hypothetical protein